MNYFNYFTEIEDTFVRRRGKHLFLSPLDWALMETWKEQGVPLHIVLRGVEKAFDSYEARPRKRSVKSLLYCQEEVEAQYQEWLEARVGANDKPNETGENGAAANMPFTLAAVTEHLEHARTSLVNAFELRKLYHEDELTEALTRAVALLDEIRNDVITMPTLDARRLEESLTGLERLLSDAIYSVVPPSDLDALKTEIKGQLRPYRSSMEQSAYDQTFNNLLLKRLREHFSVPRLSLFYL